MLKAPRRSPVETPLLFEIDPQPAEDLLTSMAGLTLVSEAFRGLGLGQSANRHLQIKERQRGLDEGTYLESFVLLNAAGGECVAGESADQRSATLVPGTSTFPVDRRPTGSWPRLLPTSRLVPADRVPDLHVSVERPLRGSPIRIVTAVAAGVPQQCPEGS